MKDIIANGHYSTMAVRIGGPSPSGPSMIVEGLRSELYFYSLLPLLTAHVARTIGHTIWLRLALSPLSFRSGGPDNL